VGFAFRAPRVIALARCGFCGIVACFRCGDVYFRAPFYAISTFRGFFGTIVMKCVEKYKWFFEELTVFVKIQSPKFKVQIRRVTKLQSSD
jgi:hypothetical protein